ncbi:ribosome-associated translation inhibitor RaiA [Persicimonas caeni]|uniref:Ribosome hibernation promoting factor n=1 Tax=Persicimonas caeni TaxID=2292766 RepID=A0A4Y6PS78_PERCE|nr:ribosome-associated translation inhibitor RaiA [Persicimonas caeni]QDG50867.1 ribosome-associated translation inhibitor RaiA [Persicimonas caeni]QED32088.1 ribosome-associated translation inhibitor RaiA [Persicimonas caeni]
MNANVSFRHMESSASLREYAVSKLERVCDKYVQGKIDATVVMSVEKHWHIADFTLHIKNFTVKGKERSEDMYSSIDLALEKIEKQLRRHKDRLKDHQPDRNGHSRMFRMGVVAPFDGGMYEESEFDEEFAEDYELYPAPSEDEAVAVAEDEDARVVQVNGGDAVKVLRNQEYEAKPMSLEEAVMQLDLLSDREFYIFTNAVSKNINIVYKRHDGNVGLIETA